MSHSAPEAGSRSEIRCQARMSSGVRLLAHRVHTGCMNLGGSLRGGRAKRQRPACPVQRFAKTRRCAPCGGPMEKPRVAGQREAKPMSVCRFRQATAETVLLAYRTPSHACLCEAAAPREAFLRSCHWTWRRAGTWLPSRRRGRLPGIGSMRSQETRRHYWQGSRGTGPRGRGDRRGRCGWGGWPAGQSASAAPRPAQLSEPNSVCPTAPACRPRRRATASTSGNFHARWTARGAHH